MQLHTQHSFGLVAIAVSALLLPSVLRAQEGSAGSPDPFEVVRRLQGTDAMRIPPRALAVIPERHTDRRIQMVDVLVAIDPQFDDLATGFGLDVRRAIQLRTREARVPIFVAKTESAVSTLLQLAMGSRVEVEGVLIARGSRYLLLASSVRPASRTGTRR